MSNPQNHQDPQYPHTSPLQSPPQQAEHPHHPQHPQGPQQWAQQQYGTPGHPGGAYPPQFPNGPSYPSGYGQPGDGQKPPKQKKPLLKRWWFWLIVVVVIIALFGAIGGGGDGSSAESASSSSADEQQADSSDTKAEEKKADTSAEETSHGIGDTVAPDDWEITVEKVDDGVAQVGDEFLNAQAQGQFVQIRLSVKNIGSEPNYFFEDDIKLGDDAGNSYSADSEAGIYAAEDNILFLEEINPGNTAQGVLVFDVPEDVDPNKLTFAGGLFSDPVEISLK